MGDDMSRRELLMRLNAAQAEIGKLQALLGESYERLGAITELAYRSGADDLRSRIKVALEVKDGSH